MPRTKELKSFSKDLRDFLIFNDSVHLIEFPKLWIDESNLLKFIMGKAGSEANPDAITEIYDAIFSVHYAEEKKSLFSQKQSIVAKIKTNKLLPLRVWAACYYLVHKRVRGDTKLNISPQIREILVEFFPDEAPTSETIRTEWLKGI